jgi:hypothetical protein
MLNSPLVQKYVDLANREADEISKVREAVATAGLNQFETNVMTWLGSMVNEIEDMDEPVYTINWNGGIEYSQSFRWHGCEGIVTSGPWGLAWKVRPIAGAWIKLGILDIYGNKIVEYLKLISDIPNTGKGEYVEKAIPTDEEEIGKFLLKMIIHIDKRKLAEKRQEERVRQNALFTMEDGFKECDDSHTLNKYLRGLIASNPEHTERWKAAAVRRTLELASIAKKKEAEERYSALAVSEEKRLEMEAAALFKPFTVYKLEIAMEMAATATEAEFKTRHVYATASVPDEAGWYSLIYQGKITKYRPGYVIGVYMVEIDTVNHKDVEILCGRVCLRSDKVEGVEVWSYATPEGLG